MSIKAEQFCYIRSVLEEFQDFSILADILCISSTFGDQEVLASVADTVNYHFDTFSAIGAASDLFAGLIEQNRSLAANRPASKSLLVSLIDLGSHFPAEAPTIQQLCGQLALCEQKSAVAACSPVSDHMAEALQSAESNFNDEFEQLLTSGTSMDKQTMSRLFSTIVKRIEHAWDHSEDEINNLGFLCSRLRVFDLKHFDSLMLVWVESLLLSNTRPELTRAVSPLVSAGCLSIRSVVACFRKLIGGANQEASSPVAAGVALNMLDLIAQLENHSAYPLNQVSYHTLRFGTHTLTFCQATYRFRLEQRRFCIARPVDAIFILSKAVELGSNSQDGAIKLKLRSLLTSSRVMSLVRFLVVRDSVNVLSNLFPPDGKVLPEGAVAFVRMIDGLLDPDHEIGEFPSASFCDLAKANRLVQTGLCEPSQEAGGNG